MNLVTFPLLCLTILIQQSFCQEEGYEKLSCELEEIQQYIVDRHNHLRSQTEPSASNMLKMEWCPEAAENARRVAECCEHSHSKAHERQISIFGCGENLYMANRPHSWEKVIQGWWDECKDFEHGHGAKTAGAVIGHYTQAAWYRSFLLGCWMSYCPNQKLKFFYVCHYCPPGNVKSIINLPYAIGERCGHCKHACSNGLCVNPCHYDDGFEDCEEHKDLCDSSEEGMPEEYMIKNMCPETCNCDNEIY